jgi:DNA polymerase/3'-5' exonuclease PolX
MSDNYLPEILFELDALRKKEQDAKNTFKSNAYAKVLAQLGKLSKVERIEDLDKITGIGKGIRARIVEILEMGHLKETIALHKAEHDRQIAAQLLQDPDREKRKQRQAEQQAAWRSQHAQKQAAPAQMSQDPDLEKRKQRQAEQQAAWRRQYAQKQAAAIELFKNIHGIGEIAAKKIVEVHNIRTIDELRTRLAADPTILNKTQQKGLIYYEAFLERIPRDEMKAHEKFLKNLIRSKYPTLELEIVGSYRRGESTSGDIDVLIKLPANKTDAFGQQVLSDIVNGTDYIVDVLALGKKKFMGVSQIDPNAPVRRLDIMITPEAEYAFSIMYFTGSMKFNIGVRRIALGKGYSMNEHGFTPKSGHPPAPVLKTEAEIFAFLGLKTIKPTDREDETILNKL